MLQQGLDLVPRLPYAPEKFVVHAGVVQAVDSFKSALSEVGFASRFITGEARSGKTHLTIWLQGHIRNCNFIPSYVDGASFESWLKTEGITRKWTDHDVVVVDDIDLYLKKITPGHSGAFVDFYEMLRRCGAKFFFVSKLSIDDLPCDAHVKSRLNASFACTLGNPEVEDLPLLVDAMAWQRGIKLKERQNAFIDRRVKREITSIENYLSRLLHLSRLFGAKVGFGLLHDAA
jgi:chromosomal replication initiation ATPase DnaA